MKSIMLATDFSERSDRALRRATLLAEQSGAALRIVHVVDDDQPRRIVDLKMELAKSLLRDLRATVTRVDGVDCTTQVVLAAPHSGLVNSVTEVQPDLLVIGPHRRQALRDVFVGTTAERTIRSVECPVLMVNSPPVGPYRRALLTTDFSDESRHAVNVFATSGLALRIRVAILHVFNVPELHLALSHMMGPEDKATIIADERKIAARDLSEFVESTEKVTAERILCHAKRKPAQEILSVAKTESIDLIVVGTHSKGGLTRFFLGSVAEEILRAASCDVLAVPPLKEPVSQLTDEYSPRSEHTRKLPT